VKISVIIPVYKAEKYLRRCIDSVINQTYKNLEIVLVDDGSPDKCGLICDEYAQNDNRITVIHKENEGVSKARNSGIKVVSGDYIYFLDSDDFIELNTISILHRHAIETNADIIIGNYKAINQNNEIKPCNPFNRKSFTKRDYKNTSEKFKYFFGKSYGRNVWNRFYKTSYLKSLDIVFEEDNLNYAEDFLFNLKVFIHSPSVVLVNEYTYYYFQNDNSITNSYKRDLTEKYLTLLNSFYEYAKELDKLNKNLDLIAFIAFNAIDISALNCYQYSDKKFVDMKNELKKFKKSSITNKAIRALAKGKYLKDVPRMDWKYYAWIVSIFFTLNFLNTTTLLLLIRFKIKNR
jgi:glycosyltransferase involved in cell wall biosynthesis